MTPRWPQARQATERTKGVKLPQVSEASHCFSATHPCLPQSFPRSNRLAQAGDWFCSLYCCAPPDPFVTNTQRQNFHFIFTSSCLSLQLPHMFSEILHQQLNTTSPQDFTFQYISQLTFQLSPLLWPFVPLYLPPPLPTSQ